MLADAGVAERTVPVTYMNSSAAIKAFTGRHGGTVCTSSNAQVALRWAFDQVGGVAGDGRCSSCPTSTSAATPPCCELGLSLDDCVVYDPRKPGGGLTHAQLAGARMILWKGHCSVHGRFSARNVAEIRERVPGVTVLVHPECTHEVVTAADLVGSTEYIIQTLDAAPPARPGRSAPSSTWSAASRRRTRTRPSSSSTAPCASAPP